jgi:hypothetical protein
VDHEEEEEEEVENWQVTRRLRTLDVGSCYNPLGRTGSSGSKLLDVTAIDLAPASKDVYVCDFLTVPIGDALVIDGSGIRKIIRVLLFVVNKPLRSKSI